jgi:L-alanine-DL-glutamate epimerase-like enolase superfamily enzyme
LFGPDLPLERITANAVRVRLPRPWGPDVTDLHLVLTEVSDTGGLVGHGFSWTPSIGAAAVQAMIASDIAPLAAVLPSQPEAAWDVLWRHLHEAGGGGVTTLALAGIDTALWDLRCRRAGRSLVDLLGRRRARVSAYGSGVNLHYPLDELVEQARRWVAAGYGAAKIKVGRPDLDDDLERVAAVRAVLGDRRRLMVDANQRWDLLRARRAVAALARYAPAWIEEPLLGDDLRAHADLRRMSAAPIALGENLATIHQFREAALLGACDVLQPNVIRVGGITPFLRIAALTRGHGLTLAPHLLPDLSTLLAVCLPDAVEVEVVEDATFADLGVLVRPSVTVTGGWCEPADASSADLGVRFRPLGAPEFLPLRAAEPSPVPTPATS